MMPAVRNLIGSIVGEGEFIGAVSGDQSTTGNITVDISGLDVQAGDLGIFFIQSTGANNGSLAISGFTRQSITESYNNGYFDTDYSFLRKEMNGTETSFSTTGQNNTNVEWGFVLLRNLNYVSYAEAAGYETVVDGASVTANFGDWVIYSIGGIFGGGSNQLDEVPTGYTAMVNDFEMTVAYKVSAGGVENPEQFSSEYQWNNATLLLRPK